MAGYCLAFRYLPMTDLPQHYAMVSIVAHHGDPAYGFAHRYTFDFLGRPYATVYLLGAGLAKVMPLGAAMRTVVALCTLAPLVGLAALLGAIGRPRIHALLAVPLAFGAVWHWGFLNFLAGTGLMLGLLAVVVAGARAPSRRRAIGLGVGALVLLFTHIHGLFMLIGLAPVFAWAWRDDDAPWTAALRTCAPIVPAALGAVAVVATTWSHAVGTAPLLAPGLGARLAHFPDRLGAGLPAPWPATSLAVLAAVAALLAGLRLAPGAAPLDRGAAARHRRTALAFAVASQAAFYLALPLNTSTAAFLSGRHALLLALFAIPLIPPLAGRRADVARVAAALVAAATLAVVGPYLARFDHRARAFDDVLAHMEPDRRVASLVFEPRSDLVHPRVLPYLHFDAYYQAARGGDVSRSFALIWNVPIRYRDDYTPHPVAEEVEFDPRRFSLEDDLPNYDYLLIRSPRPPALPPDTALREVVRSGDWTLLANPAARPDPARPDPVRPDPARPASRDVAP